MDSTTLAFWLREQGFTIEAIYFDYEQGKTNSEKMCAMTIAGKLGIFMHIVETPLPSDSISNIISSPRKPTQLDDIKAFGNVAGMCMMALTFALLHDFDSIGLGLNAENTRTHPGLNTVFFETMERLASMWTGRRIMIMTPFLEKSKSSIIRIGTRSGVPYADTWSCGASVKKHCGTCVECISRKEAFKEVEMPDPTKYET